MTKELKPCPLCGANMERKYGMHYCMNDDCWYYVETHMIHNAICEKVDKLEAEVERLRRGLSLYAEGSWDKGHIARMYLEHCNSLVAPKVEEGDCPLCGRSSCRCAEDANG